MIDKFKRRFTTAFFVSGSLYVYISFRITTYCFNQKFMKILELYLT